MNLIWETSVFHFLSPSSWFRDRHVIQVESIRAYLGTSPGIKRKYI